MPYQETHWGVVMSIYFLPTLDVFDIAALQYELRFQRSCDNHQERDRWVQLRKNFGQVPPSANFCILEIELVLTDGLWRRPIAP